MKEREGERVGDETVTRITLDLPTDLLARLDAHVGAVRERVRRADDARGSPIPGMFAPRRSEIIAKALRFYLAHAKSVASRDAHRGDRVLREDTIKKGNR